VTGNGARLRAELSEVESSLVDALTAEGELRAAPGEPITATHEIGLVAAARLFILIDLLTRSYGCF
jgi:hypothetical protein